jgi:hypothetical protein
MQHSPILCYIHVWCIYIYLYPSTDLSQFHGSHSFYDIFFTDVQPLRPEHHWRDLICQNTHLVHQNWYLISFACVYVKHIWKSWSWTKTCRIYVSQQHTGRINALVRLTISSRQIFLLWWWNSRSMHCHILHVQWERTWDAVVKRGLTRTAQDRVVHINIFKRWAHARSDY